VLCVTSLRTPGAAAERRVLLQDSSTKVFGGRNPDSIPDRSCLGKRGNGLLCYETRLVRDWDARGGSFGTRCWGVASTVESERVLGDNGKGGVTGEGYDQHEGMLRHDGNLSREKTSGTSYL